MAALGNRPNIRVNIDTINGFENSDLSEVVFSVIESNGVSTRKVPSSDVLPALSTAIVSQTLQQKHSLEGISQRCSFTDDQVLQNESVT
jgi:hypothetical protein